jgi:YegS/Rv2252/BmrU family lipid kinase
MSTYAIVNPAAGRGRARRLWPRIEPRLRAAVSDLTVAWTSAPGEATHLARSAARAGHERLVAVGGDGTFHEVVNGLYGTDSPRRAGAPRLLPLACGTGDDFRRSLGVPPVPEALSRLPALRSRRIDLLRVNYTNRRGERARCHALNVTSFGLSGRIVRTLQRRRASRSLLPARLQYVGALLRALLSHRPVAADLVLDGSALPGSSLHLAAVANGHSFGGGIRIAPGAVLDDGRLRVTVLHDTPAAALLCRLPRFYRGTHSAIEGVTIRTGRRLTARPRQSESVPVEADGELLGRLPAAVTVVPDALRLEY